jgi:FkbM family methyltransferase
MLIPTIFSTFPECIPEKGILHVGAHMCEERALYNSINVGDNDILWIEAIGETVTYVKKINENINIVQAVITDKDYEELNFMITNNKESSSIFNFGTHAIEHPHVFEIERRRLKSITLNTLFERNNIPRDRYDFINIDIQGAELKALKGAVHILPHIKAIYAEVNEKMLYEGAGLLPELDEYLATFNFKRVITNMTRHGWGDALYIKNYVIPASPSGPIINMNDIDTMNYMNTNDII